VCVIPIPDPSCKSRFANSLAYTDLGLIPELRTAAPKHLQLTRKEMMMMMMMSIDIN